MVACSAKAVRQMISWLAGGEDVQRNISFDGNVSSVVLIIKLLSNIIIILNNCSTHPMSRFRVIFVIHKLYVRCLKIYEEFRWKFLCHHSVLAPLQFLSVVVATIQSKANDGEH